jgi:molybdate transport system substrate-binding protein
MKFVAYFLTELLLMAISPAFAGEAHVAVAANFLPALKKLSQSFEEQTGHHVLITSGSTGQLYAQISHGAPFDVFLAADQERPRRLEAKGFTVPDSRFTYAIGQLVLWSTDAGISKQGWQGLLDEKVKHIAIANPRIAPYGQAALQTLQGLGLWDKVQAKLVQGENAGQAFQFAATGNAQAGFVALAQVLDANKTNQGGYWLVPPELYTPIKQDAVLLTRARNNAAAQAFYNFLRDPGTRSIIQAAGYEHD